MEGRGVVIFSRVSDLHAEEVLALPSGGVLQLRKMGRLRHLHVQVPSNKHAAEAPLQHECATTGLPRVNITKQEASQQHLGTTRFNST